MTTARFFKTKTVLVKIIVFPVRASKAGEGRLHSKSLRILIMILTNAGA